MAGPTKRRALKTMLQKLKSQWKCPKCTLDNPGNKRRCIVCDTRRPVADVSNEPPSAKKRRVSIHMHTSSSSVPSLVVTSTKKPTTNVNKSNDGAITSRSKKTKHTSHITKPLHQGNELEDTTDTQLSSRKAVAPTEDLGRSSPLSDKNELSFQATAANNTTNESPRETTIMEPDQRIIVLEDEQQPSNKAIQRPSLQSTVTTTAATTTHPTTEQVDAQRTDKVDKSDTGRETTFDPSTMLHPTAPRVSTAGTAGTSNSTPPIQGTFSVVQWLQSQEETLCHHESLLTEQSDLIAKQAFAIQTLLAETRAMRKKHWEVLEQLEQSNYGITTPSTDLETPPSRKSMRLDTTCRITTHYDGTTIGTEESESPKRDSFVANSRPADSHLDRHTKGSSSPMETESVPYHEALASVESKAVSSGEHNSTGNDRDEIPNERPPKSDDLVEQSHCDSEPTEPPPTVQFPYPKDDNTISEREPRQYLKSSVTSSKSPTSVDQSTIAACKQRTFNPTFFAEQRVSVQANNLSKGSSSEQQEKPNMHWVPARFVERSRQVDIADDSEPISQSKLPDAPEASICADFSQDSSQSIDPTLDTEGFVVPKKKDQQSCQVNADCQVPPKKSTTTHDAMTDPQPVGDFSQFSTLTIDPSTGKAAQQLLRAGKTRSEMITSGNTLSAGNPRADFHPFHAATDESQANAALASNIKAIPNSANRIKHSNGGWVSNVRARRFIAEMDAPCQRFAPSSVPVSTAVARPPKRQDELWDSQEPGYAYKETVRCKEHRNALGCHDCPNCREFYNVLRKTGHDVPEFNGEVGNSQQFGRHRARFAPSETPEGFWDLDFEDERKAGTRKSFP